MNLQGVYKYLCIYMCTLCDWHFIYTCDAKVAIYPKVLYTCKSKKKKYTYSNRVLDIKSSKYTCNTYFYFSLLSVLTIQSSEGLARLWTFHWAERRHRWGLPSVRHRWSPQTSRSATPHQLLDLQQHNQVSPTTTSPVDTYNIITRWDLQHHNQVSPTTT